MEITLLNHRGRERPYPEERNWCQAGENITGPFTKPLKGAKAVGVGGIGGICNTVNKKFKKETTEVRELGKSQIQSALRKIHLIACIGEGVGGEEPGGRRGESAGVWGADSDMQAKE